MQQTTSTPGLRTRLLLLAAAALTASGCYLAADGRALERQVRALEARHTEFVSTFESERQELTELALQAEREIEALQAALREAQRFLQRNNADLGVRVDELERRMQELNGRIEEAMFATGQLREEMELLRQDLEMQIMLLDPSSTGAVEEAP